MPREDEIRLIAYELWQEDGCCHGHDVDHWVRAEIIWEEQKSPPVQAATKSAPKSAAAPKTRTRPAKKRTKARK
jgi:hypothetical protein